MSDYATGKRLALEDGAEVIVMLRAEIEQLRADADKKYEEAFNVGYEEAKENYVEAVGKLSAEIERLRAALQSIYLVVKDSKNNKYTAMVCREALEQKDTEPVICSDKSRGPLGLD